MSDKLSVEKMRHGIAEMRGNMEIYVEMHATLAQITRIKFNALRKEGFSEAQAIELCRTNSPLL